MANVVIASTSRDVPSSHLYFCGGRDDEAEVKVQGTILFLWRENR